MLQITYYLFLGNFPFYTTFPFHLPKQKKQKKIGGLFIYKYFCLFSSFINLIVVFSLFCFYNFLLIIYFSNLCVLNKLTQFVLICACVCDLQHYFFSQPPTKNQQIFFNENVNNNKKNYWNLVNKICY